MGGFTNWTGDNTKEIIAAAGRYILIFDEYGKLLDRLTAPSLLSHDGMIANVAGDLREEYIAITEDKIFVFSNPFPPTKDGREPIVSNHAWDTNGDGTVDISDLVFVASHFGIWDMKADINGDGLVNTADVLLVGLHLEKEIYRTLSGEPSDLALLRSLYTQLGSLPNPSSNTIHALQVLQQLIAQEAPDQTRLLQNYPNPYPFNPETWIPYELAEDAFVEITIYTASGHSIRTLSLGEQSIGTYITQDKAAHWDGRTDKGERVSNGVYYYHFRAGEFHDTKRMTIVK